MKREKLTRPTVNRWLELIDFLLDEATSALLHDEPGESYGLFRGARNIAMTLDLESVAAEECWSWQNWSRWMLDATKRETREAG